MKAKWYRYMEREDLDHGSEKTKRSMGNRANSLHAILLTPTGSVRALVPVFHFYISIPLLPCWFFSMKKEG
jgi:hypothetical protein